MQAELVIQMLSPDYYVNNHRPYNFVRKKNKTIVKTYPRRTGWHRWDSRFWRDSRRRSPSCCQSCSTWGRIVADESPWCHPLGQHRDPRHPCHCHPPVRSSLLDRTRDQLLLQLNKKKYISHWLYLFDWLHRKYMHQNNLKQMHTIESRLVSLPAAVSNS